MSKPRQPSANPWAGGASVRSPSRSERPLWTCPKCGHQFVTANIWHSCVQVELASHFAGKPASLLETFERYVELARACGPVTVYAQKSRIVIQARVRFAGAVVRKNWLDAGLWLKRRAQHPRLVRIEDFGKAGFGHHFRLSTPDEVDDDLAELVREAYQIGIQAAL